MNTPDQNKKDQQEKAFPGYPSYPASDDVTNQSEKVDFGKLHKAKGDVSVAASEQRGDAIARPRNSDEVLDPETDVTPEDLAMLAAADQNRDMDDPDSEESILDTTDDDGDPLNEPRGSYGSVGADLDVPGSENDDGNENIGDEDEENNYYSLGGDEKENLEETS